MRALLIFMALVGQYSVLQATEPPSQGCMVPISETFILPKSCSEAKPEPISDIPQRVLNWGSGGLGGIPWRFSESLCNDFLISLTKSIRNHIPNIKLSPHDLFHAHMINYETQALALVFHAKEYPHDLEKAKNYYQVESQKFYSFDRSFRDRNFVYFSQDTDFAHKNILYLVRDQDSCHRWFDPQGANTLSQERLARDVRKGRNAGDINIFVPETLKNISYNLSTQEEVLSGKSNERRKELNEAFHKWLSQKKDPFIYMLTGFGTIIDTSN